MIWRSPFTASARCLAGCVAPSATGVAQEDPALLQEILRRQEQRVAHARTELAKLERELRLLQMRRRMLERAGRHDLALALEYEEHGVRTQLAAARRAIADEEDALAIYRRRAAPPPP